MVSSTRRDVRDPGRLSPGRPAVTVWAAGVLGALGCAGSVPPDASCYSSGDCETGLACLYALGSGCGAPGRCAIPARDCSGTSAGLVLCACGAAVLDLSCVPSSVALAQRTATGAACPRDAGSAGPEAAR